WGGCSSIGRGPARRRAGAEEIPARRRPGTGPGSSRRSTPGPAVARVLPDVGRGGARAGQARPGVRGGVAPDSVVPEPEQGEGGAGREDVEEQAGGHLDQQQG